MKIKKACWAEGYGNCSGILSKEHVISKGVLMAIGEGSVNYRVNEGKTFKLGKNSATLPILCTNHNSLLSKYDEEAKRFYYNSQKIFQSISGDFKGNTESIHCEINGNLLERWAAKTMLNHFAFDMTTNKNNIPYFGLGGNWIADWLFNGSDIESPFGLYFLPAGTMLHRKNASPPYYASLIAEKIFHWNGSQQTQYRLPIFYYFSCFMTEIIACFNVSGMGNENWLQILNGKSVFQGNGFLSKAYYRKHAIKYRGFEGSAEHSIDIVW